MATLTIPNVDEDLEERLRELARLHGRSVEAEARAILTDAVASTASAPEAENIADAILAIMAPIGGIDLASYPDQPAQEPPPLG